MSSTTAKEFLYFRTFFSSLLSGIFQHSPFFSSLLSGIFQHSRGEEGVDFDEIVNLFSDLGDPVLDTYKEFGITEDQYQLLKSFRDAFYAFADENDWPPDFLDTPEWEKITVMAKEVLKAFDL